MPHISSLTQADQEALFLEFVQEIHAGFPSPAADCAGERIDIARELTSHPETTFYARVSGDSMHDAGLFDGDIIVIDKSLEPHNGDIIIAAVDGEFTVKEFRKFLEDITETLDENKQYRIALRYKKIAIVKQQPVVFYFEKVQ